MLLVLNILQVQAAVAGHGEGIIHREFGKKATYCLSK